MVKTEEEVRAWLSQFRHWYCLVDEKSGEETRLIYLTQEGVTVYFVFCKGELKRVNSVSR